MDKNFFLVRIKGGKTSCLAAQLVQILEVINASTKGLIWYGADVEVIGDIPFKLGLEEWSPKKIGDTKIFIKGLKQVDQFLSGVFFAFPTDVGDVLEGRFSTEDEPYRSSKGAILEIRAFDTSYYEVYSYGLDIIAKLADFFSVKYEKN